MTQVTVFSTSFRDNSLNTRLALCVQKTLQSISEVEVNYLSLKNFNIPLYEGDLEEKSGIPADVKSLSEQIVKTQALVICSPEYNGSISAPLKNILDWVSRVRPNPWQGKSVFLLSASPGALGGLRGLWHARVPFAALGCHVYPEMVAVGKAHEALSADSQILDEKLKSLIEKNLSQFIHFSKSLENI
ncbi:MAG: NADPH-dependent FMN reductase [Pseudobdellovibrionaceae bacterium]